MTTSTTPAPQQPAQTARLRRLSRIFTWSHAVVVALASLSLYLGLANLSGQGYANYYYAAAVRSMMQNWHAFYFASLDSRGFVSIDKPPAGFWIQTASALLFGFHGWSLLLPQAVAGAGSVVLIYAIVKRFFGAGAGLLAALAMTISPINVAVARNNTPDGLLVFMLLAASLCFCIGIQRGRMPWLVAAFALVGVGFNIKMMEAYLVLPGMVVAYLFASHSSFLRRIGHLAVATLVMIIVSFTWATTVWLTPANDRPYIGSTKDNNIFSLIFGYNGVNRLLPKGWSIFGFTNGSVARGAATTRVTGQNVQRIGENGPQGIFRLFNHQLGGQIGWLIPLALIGLLAAWGRPRWRNWTQRQSILLMFGIWAMTEIAVFSEAGFYHRYYLATLSPSIAVLSGVGAAALWRCFPSFGWRAIALPATIIVTAAVQLHVLAIYPLWRTRLTPILIAGAGLATIVLFVGVMIRRWTWINPNRLRSIVGLIASACLCTLFAAPGIWSYATITRGYEGALPIGGPNAQTFATAASASAKKASQSASVDVVAHTELAPRPLATHKSVADHSGRVMMRYLTVHQGKTAYVVAVVSSREADPIIVNTGAAVMTLGGFGGSDPIVDVPALRRLIKSNQVRFFLIHGNAQSLASSLADLRFAAPDTRLPDVGTAQALPVTAWVERTCVRVPPAKIAAATRHASTAGLTGLYDCRGKGA